MTSAAEAIWRQALRACELLDAGRAEEALGCLGSCAGAGWALLLRARAKQALGKERLAISDVTRAFEIDPESGWIFDLPLKKLAVPGHAAAPRLYELNRRFKSRPESYPVWAFVGKLKAMEGLGPEGLAHIDWAVRARPRQPYLWAWRAQAKRRLGDFQGALEDAEAALGQDARHAVAHAAKAAALRQTGCPEEALKAATLAARFAPAYEAGPLEAARACLLLRQGRGVLKWVERAVRRAGRYGWRSLYEGSEADLRDLDRFAADRSLREDRLQGRLHAWRGEALLAMGRFGPASQSLRRAISLFPGHAWSHAWLGEALGHLGAEIQGLEALGRAVALDPRYARAWISRGRLHLKLNEPKRALSCLDQAVRLDPRWALSRYWRARTRERLGQAAAACAELDFALRLDARFAEAYRRRALIQRRLGRPGEALADLERYRDLTVARRPS